MKHTTSRLLFAYWDELRGSRPAPERGEIEPGRIRHILADTFVLAADPSGSATFRLVGTRCSALFGRDLREESFEALWGPAGHGEARHFVADIVADVRGTVIGAIGSGSGGEELVVEMLLLPLLQSGRPQARLIGALSPASVPAWMGVVPVTGLRATSLRVIHSDRPPLPGERLFARRQSHRFVVHEGGRTGRPEASP